MSTAEVSGALALLREAQPSLTAAQAKTALQVTSSRLPGAGLIEAGAGEVNVMAALALVSGDAGFRKTAIAREDVTSNGLAFGSRRITSSSNEGDTIVWGDTID
jgi:hypothetical protein